MLGLRKPLLGDSVDLVQVGPKLSGTAMLKVEVEEAIFLAGCDKFLQLQFILIKEIGELDSGDVRRGNKAFLVFKPISCADSDKKSHCIWNTSSNSITGIYKKSNPVVEAASVPVSSLVADRTQKLM